MLRRKKVLLETPNRRRRRRIRLIRRMIVLVLACGLLIGLCMWIVRIPALTIQTVTVSGTSRTDADALKRVADDMSSGAYGYIVPKRFVIGYPRHEIAERILNDFKTVHQVKVRRTSLTSVEIAVKERSTAALYCGMECYHLDDQGYAFETGMPTDSFTRFVNVRATSSDASGLGTSLIEPRVMHDLVDFTRQLETVGLKFQFVEMDGNDRVNVVTEQGRLIISTKESLVEQFELLKTALPSIPTFSYIDLRFGKKIFYKTSASSTPAI